MKSFEHALMDLLDQYADTSIQEKIMALELRLMALQEEAEDGE